MPEQEPQHTPEFNPDEASISLKRAAETAAEEGKLATAGRQAGVIEGHEQTMEEIAAMAEQQLGGTGTLEGATTEQAAHEQHAAEVLAAEKKEKADTVTAAAALVNELESSPTLEDGSTSYKTFHEATEALNQEGRGAVAVLPDLEQYEDLVQRQMLTVESHIGLLHNTPGLPPAVEQYLVSAQEYKQSFQETLRQRRTAFVEGFHLGDLGQVQRVQEKTINELQGMMKELDTLIAYLKNLSGSGQAGTRE